jgi:cobalt/nickel transport protein
MKVLLTGLFCVSCAFAHFQTVIVDKSVLEQKDGNEISISYEFTHPFEQELMNMVKPQDAGVFIDGKKSSFLNSLKSAKKGSQTTWSAKYTIKEPGVYQFYVDPVPYFEPAEDKFIKHQTKTIVDAFGSGEGWDEPIGLKAEIVPLSRPYSLYTGNIFSAQVLYKSKPVPNAEIEIEFYNTKGLKAPNDAYVTQVIKADQNGVFHTALPFEGWWGFAALIDDDESIKKDGKEYPVELGAVLWLRTQSVK